MVLFREKKLEKHWRTFENCCLMSKNPLFKKDSDIFTHIFWVTLTAAMTVKRQRSCTLLPGHRDQSQPSRSREQQLQPHASGGAAESPCPMSHLPVSGLPSSTPSSAHSVKRHWSSPNPRINRMLIDKLDQKKKEQNNTQKKKKQWGGDGYLWTIFMREHCLLGQGTTSLHTCPPKFQDVAYTVDAVVLYISVTVESWDFHQGTSVQSERTRHLSENMRS